MTERAKPPSAFGRNFTLGLIWLAATIVHFGLCVELAYYYGRLVDVDAPDWLRSLDQVLFYLPSIAAEFLVLIVWWCVVGLVAWPLCRAVMKSATLLFGEAVAAAAKQAAWRLAPTFVFSLLSLFLFPAVAPRHSEMPTTLDLAPVLTPQGFGYYTILGLHCLLALTIMFVILVLTVGFFDKQWRAPVWGFFVGLTLGLSAAGGFCAGLYPAMDALFERVGLFGSAAVYLTSVAVVTTLPRLVNRKPSPFGGEAAR